MISYPLENISLPFSTENKDTVKHVEIEPLYKSTEETVYHTFSQCTESTTPAHMSSSFFYWLRVA